MEAAVRREELAGEAGELAHEVAEDLADGGALGIDRGLAAGVRAQDGGKANVDRHSGSSQGDGYDETES